MADDGSGVVVVGAGRVGTALAARLLLVGQRVDGIVTRSAASAARAARVVPSVAPVALDSQAVAAASVVLLCVADDELATVVSLLGAAAGRAQATRLVAHTSGRHGLAVLRAATGLHAAIHPVMTFAGGGSDAASLAGIAYGVTAEGPALTAATALVEALGGVVEVVPEQHRATYHAALSHAANHLVTLIADAADLLRAAGVTDTSRVLGPITRAALGNTLAEDAVTGLPAADGALTGPVVRGDAGTIRAHLDALAGSPAEAAYRAMATRTTERAAAAGRLGPEAAQAILDLVRPQVRPR